MISLGDHVAIRLNDSNAQKGFFYKSDGSWHGTGVDSTLSPGWHFFTYTNYDSIGVELDSIESLESSSSTGCSSSLISTSFKAFIPISFL